MNFQQELVDAINHVADSLEYIGEALFSFTRGVEEEEVTIVEEKEEVEGENLEPEKE